MIYTILGWAFGLYILAQLIKLLIEAIFPSNLKGKTVVVIGATTGFGHDFVLKCAQRGMTVFAACNSPNGTQKVMDSTAALAGTVHAHQLDLASKQSVEQFFQFVKERLLPGAGLNALVNNAGIIRAGADDWLTMEDYEIVFRVNMLGLIHVTKMFKEHIKLAKGRIVFCSSICGRIAFPLYGPYTVSKFAMEGYADTIRRELTSFGVRVAIVEPGYFRTPITDPKHIPNEMERTFQQAPAQIREQYGKEFIAKASALAHQHLASAANSPHVEWVVDVYFHACTARFPRKRYVVGIDANFVVVPIARLPAELQDLAFWLHSLIVGAPVPKALMKGGGESNYNPKQHLDGTKKIGQNGIAKEEENGTIVNNYCD